MVEERLNSERVTGISTSVPWKFLTKVNIGFGFGLRSKVQNTISPSQFYIPIFFKLVIGQFFNLKYLILRKINMKRSVTSL